MDITQNLVDVTYNRYFIGFDRANHKFLTVNSKSSDNTGNGHFTLNYTENGITSEKSIEVVYGAYLHVGENIQEYSYEAENIITLLSEIGGFIEIIFLALASIPLIYNTNLAEKKYLDKLYFIDKVQDKDDSLRKSTPNVERF